MTSGIDDGKNRRFNKGFDKPNNLVIYSLVGILLISFISLQYYLPLANKSNQRFLPYNSSALATTQLIDDAENVAYRLVVVTDLDHGSKHKSKEHTWQSFLLFGRLDVSKDLQKADIEWEKRSVELATQISSGGRAMELSDLVVFNGHLLTVDDRTGIIYRIDNFKDVIPMTFLNDGPGNTTKSFKAEWMTVKDEMLYVGGLGKEWTTPAGEFVNNNPMYIKVISHTGEIEHVNWVNNYHKLCKAVGIEYPGYMIHESAQWSNFHNRWFFLPRRASKTVYSETTDEFKGTNILLIANEDFSEVTHMKVGGDLGDGTRGFSAFQFLPGSQDDIIVALKSEERDGVAVGSYIVVFSYSTGRILLEEKALTGPYKFEGLAFI